MIHGKVTEQDAPVEDFSEREVYLLDCNEDSSIRELDSIIQNRSGIVRLHAGCQAYANLVLQRIKDVRLPNSEKIAGGFKPGDIVWARSKSKLYYPARV